MNRYAAMNARARILSYYSPTPHEVAMKKEREPFDRAKSEWLKNARIALEETEAMTFEEWQATRETFKARKPDECSECGQQYRTEAANVERNRPAAGLPDDGPVDGRVGPHLQG